MDSVRRTMLFVGTIDALLGPVTHRCPGDLLTASASEISGHALIRVVAKINQSKSKMNLNTLSLSLFDRHHIVSLGLT